MRTTITLYNKSDPDLLGLYEQVGSKEFSILLKDSLRTLVRPNYKAKDPPLFINKYTGDRERIPLGLSLTSKKDKDIEELLRHVRPGNLCVFCKMALRFYLGNVLSLSAFLDLELNPTVVYHTQTSSIFNISNIYVESVSSPKKQIQHRY